MPDVLPTDVLAVLDAGTTDPDPLLTEMAAHGRDRGFPIVGPDAGRLIRLLARFADVERVFEFGSGFGYSAAWFLGALPDDGEIVLTEYDADNLDRARDFLARADSDATVHYEAGDAFETVENYDGPFDAAFVDCDKKRYLDALDAVRPKLTDGALVVADNVLEGPVTPGEMRDALDGQPPTDAARGIGAYVEAVNEAPFETAIVPLGEGLAVSRYSP